MPTTEYTLDGKKYWVIDDETTYDLFAGNEEFAAADVCDMCVDGGNKESCPTADALGVKQKPCESIILDEEHYAHYIAKRMET